MSYEYKLPSLGDGVTGQVTEILVKVGDQIEEEDTLMIVSTDKVDAEMPSDVAGTVEEILVNVGDEVKEGDLLVKINAGGESSDDTDKAQETSKQEEKPEESTPSKEETKADSTQKETPKEEEKTVNQPQQVGGDANYRMSPLARKIARELGIDSATLKPSDGNRIKAEDVLQAAKSKQDELEKAAKKSASTGGGGVAFQPLPNFEKFGKVERKAMSRINEVTAVNMHYSFSVIPHAWISEKADITDIEAMRQQYKGSIKAKGGSLTITAILVKAIAVVLRKMPQFNASIDMESKELVFKDYINIGVAVDTPRGLLVPVIRDVDRKGLTEISIELSELSKRTREGKNKITDMERGSGNFSISNIGGIGGTDLKPIVNSPEVAILGVTASKMEPVWNGSEFIPRLMMPMHIGFDHRVINGADAIRFLVELKNIMEDPFLGWF
ncbi:MAG: 2-oxo acid dehydrogenase subunit E2 [Chitinophagales bacterium]